MVFMQNYIYLINQYIANFDMLLDCYKIFRMDDISTKPALSASVSRFLCRVRFIPLYQSSLHFKIVFGCKISNYKIGRHHWNYELYLHSDPDIYGSYFIEPMEYCSCLYYKMCTPCGTLVDSFMIFDDILNCAQSQMFSDIHYKPLSFVIKCKHIF